MALKRFDIFTQFLNNFYCGSSVDVSSCTGARQRVRRGALNSDLGGKLRKEIEKLLGNCDQAKTFSTWN